MADKNQQAQQKNRCNVRLFQDAKTLEEKKSLKELYEASGVILDKTLKPLLEAKIEESLRKTESIDTYDIIHRDQFLADQLGYRRGLREVLKLLPRS